MTYTYQAPSRRENSLLTTLKQQARLLALASAFIITATQAHAQGCVTAHGSGLPKAQVEMGDTEQRWDASVSYRWFQSDRHYVGIAYQPQRDAAGDQVINRSNFVDLGLNYTISPRYSLTLTVPFVHHDRSQTLKKNGVVFERYHTQSFGLSDASIAVNAWIFNPTTSTKGNVQVNLGLVLPTGKYDVMDTFESYNATTDTVTAQQRYVDNSIQPGLGGYGISVGFSGYRILGAGFTAFGNANYTITPQEQNHVGNSIGDSYVGRGGVEYSVAAMKGLSLSLGLRAEGVAVYDLIGGSLGSRRPGYSVAVEPGIIFNRKNWTARLYVPIAFQRNRLQSYPDKVRTWATGVYRQGDAAFADYLIAWSFDYRF